MRHKPTCTLSSNRGKLAWFAFLLADTLVAHILYQPDVQVVEEIAVVIREHALDGHHIDLASRGEDSSDNATGTLNPKP